MINIREVILSISALFLCNLNAEVWVGNSPEYILNGELLSLKSKENVDYITIRRDDNLCDIEFDVRLLCPTDQKYASSLAAYRKALEEYNKSLSISKKTAEQNINQRSVYAKCKVVQVLNNMLHVVINVPKYDTYYRRYIDSFTGSRIAIITKNTNYFAEQDIIDLRDYRQYWIGNYTYTTVDDRSITILKYTDNKQQALDYWIQKDLPPKPREPVRETTRIESEIDSNTDVAGSGTGFAITDDGYVLTNAHVVANAKSIKVHGKSFNRDAQVISVDRENDLALIKINYELDPLYLNFKTDYQIAKDVSVLGFPNIGLQGLSMKYSAGSISSTTGFKDDNHTFQVSAPIQPGNSGSPVLDENMHVIGVISSTLNPISTIVEDGYIPQNVNYAIKLNAVKSLLESNRTEYKKLNLRSFPIIKDTVPKLTEDNTVLMIVTYNDSNIRENSLEKSKSIMKDDTILPRSAETFIITLPYSRSNDYVRRNWKISEKFIFSSTSEMRKELDLIYKSEEPLVMERAVAQRKKIEKNNLIIAADKKLRTGMTRNEVRELMKYDPDSKYLKNGRWIEVYGHITLTYYPMGIDIDNWEIERVERKSYAPKAVIDPFSPYN